MFPQDFPHAIHQVLAIPLTKLEMLQADIMRSVYLLAAVGEEIIVIACLMNLHCEWLLTIAGGEPTAILIIEVESEDFDFDSNLHDDSQD